MTVRRPQHTPATRSVHSALITSLRLMGALPALLLAGSLLLWLVMHVREAEQASRAQALATCNTYIAGKLTALGNVANLLAADSTMQSYLSAQTPRPLTIVPLAASPNHQLRATFYTAAGLSELVAHFPVHSREMLDARLTVTPPMPRRTYTGPILEAQQPDSNAKQHQTLNELPSEAPANAPTTPQSHLQNYLHTGSTIFTDPHSPHIISVISRGLLGEQSMDIIQSARGLCLLAVAPVYAAHAGKQTAKATPAGCVVVEAPLDAVLLQELGRTVNGDIMLIWGKPPHVTASFNMPDGQPVSGIWERAPALETVSTEVLPETFHATIERTLQGLTWEQIGAAVKTYDSIYGPASGPKAEEKTHAAAQPDGTAVMAVSAQTGSAAKRFSGEAAPRYSVLRRPDGSAVAIIGLTVPAVLPIPYSVVASMLLLLAFTIYAVYRYSTHLTHKTFAPLHTVLGGMYQAGNGQQPYPIAISHTAREWCELADAIRALNNNLHSKEAARKRAEHCYHDLFTNAAEGVMHFSPDGILQDVNPALVRLLGFTSAGECIASARPLEEQLAAHCKHHNITAKTPCTEEKAFTCMLQLPHRDGNIIYATTAVRLLIMPRNIAAASQEPIADSATASHASEHSFGSALRASSSSMYGKRQRGSRPSFQRANSPNEAYGPGAAPDASQPATSGCLLQLTGNIVTIHKQEEAPPLAHNHIDATVKAPSPSHHAFLASLASAITSPLSSLLQASGLCDQPRSTTSLPPKLTADADRTTSSAALHLHALTGCLLEYCRAERLTAASNSSHNHALQLSDLPHLPRLRGMPATPLAIKATESCIDPMIIAEAATMPAPERNMTRGGITCIEPVQNEQEATSSSDGNGTAPSQHGSSHSATSFYTDTTGYTHRADHTIRPFNLRTLLTEAVQTIAKEPVAEENTAPASTPDATLPQDMHMAAEENAASPEPSVPVAPPVAPSMASQEETPPLFVPPGYTEDSSATLRLDVASDIPCTVEGNVTLVQQLFTGLLSLCKWHTSTGVILLSASIPSLAPDAVFTAYQPTQPDADERSARNALTDTRYFGIMSDNSIASSTAPREDPTQKSDHIPSASDTAAKEAPGNRNQNAPLKHSPYTPVQGAQHMPVQFSVTLVTHGYSLQPPAHCPAGEPVAYDEPGRVTAKRIASMNNMTDFSGFAPPHSACPVLHTGEELMEALIHSLNGTVLPRGKKTNTYSFILPFIRSQSCAAAELALTGTTVLLVTANPQDRTLLQTLCRNAQLEYATAATAQEALHQLCEQAYDAVIMDVELPETNGIQLLRTIRSSDDSGIDAAVPVLAYTGFSDPAFIGQCTAAGATSVFTKPLRMETITAALQKCCLPKQDKHHAPVLFNALRGYLFLLKKQLLSKNMSVAHKVLERSAAAHPYSGTACTIVDTLEQHITTKQWNEALHTFDQLEEELLPAQAVHEESRQQHSADNA